tara:strand:+ start:211 stop:519 length:309 start_codon:yes stop_codon:yes gene_type:complete
MAIRHQEILSHTLPKESGGIVQLLMTMSGEQQSKRGLVRVKVAPVAPFLSEKSSPVIRSLQHILLLLNNGIIRRMTKAQQRWPLVHLGRLGGFVNRAIASRR